MLEKKLAVKKSVVIGIKKKKPKKQKSKDKDWLSLRALVCSCRTRTRGLVQQPQATHPGLWLEPESRL